MSSQASEYVPEDKYVEEDQEVPKSTRKSTKGRKLVRWNPEKDQLVLLCAEYIATRDGVDLDWDAIAKEVEPTLSGDAIKQHLLKLRIARDGEGQKNPPKLDRKTIIAARKKNPLVDTSKPPKTPKRRVKKSNDDDDSDGEPTKPAPKTTGLLHLKVEKGKTSAPKKRKIKQESDDDMGGYSSKENAGDDSPVARITSKKRKANIPSNFPPPSAPPANEEPPLPSAPVPAPPTEPHNEAMMWTPRFDLQDEGTFYGAGQFDEALAPLQRARGGTVYGAPLGLVFGGEEMGPPGLAPDSEDANLPSRAGGFPALGACGGVVFGDEPFGLEGFFGDEG